MRKVVRKWRQKKTWNMKEKSLKLKRQILSYNFGVDADRRTFASTLREHFYDKSEQVFFVSSCNERHTARPRVDKNKTKNEVSAKVETFIGEIKRNGHKNL